MTREERIRALNRLAELGLCHGHPNARWWTSTDPAERAAAILVCYGCGVQADCHAYAVRAREPAGVWGGRDRTIEGDHRARRGGRRTVAEQVAVRGGVR